MLDLDCIEDLFAEAQWCATVDASLCDISWHVPQVGVHASAEMTDERRQHIAEGVRASWDGRRGTTAHEPTDKRRAQLAAADRNRRHSPSRVEKQRAYRAAWKKRKAEEKRQAKAA